MTVQPITFVIRPKKCIASDLALILLLLSYVADTTSVGVGLDATPDGNIVVAIGGKHVSDEQVNTAAGMITKLLADNGFEIISRDE